MRHPALGWVAHMSRRRTPRDLMEVASRRLEQMSDIELLALVGTGRGAAAFGVFYTRYEPAVLAYMRRRVRDAELAADLTAETFAAALGSAARFQAVPPAEAAGVAWLFAIARNVLVTSSRRKRVADEARRVLGVTAPLVLHDHTLERVDELASLPAGLTRALALLVDDQRDAVIARIVDEVDYEQIARDMACSELVARQRVSRGLARLRALMTRAAAE